VKPYIVISDRTPIPPHQSHGSKTSPFTNLKEGLAEKADGVYMAGKKPDSSVALTNLEISTFPEMRLEAASQMDLQAWVHTVF
jgi:hypothetical protein